MTDPAALVKQRKVVSSTVFTTEKNIQVANNTNFLHIETDLEDESGITMPGLTLRIEWREEAIECNEKYSLYHFADGRKQRLFQIEVYPFQKFGHRGAKPIKGPHIHYLDDLRPTKTGYSCGIDNRSLWFYRFCRHTNIAIRYEDQIPLLNQWLR